LVVLGGCGRIAFDPLGDASRDAGGDGALPTPVARIAINGENSFAIDTQHRLFCWGANADGECGQGHFNPVMTPVQIAGEWLEVESGDYHLCAIAMDGGVSCWGANGNGDLGTGDYTLQNVPTKISVTAVVSHLAVGQSHNTAISDSGDRWIWGDNRNGGPLGTGVDTDQYLIPVVAPIASSGWTALTAGWGHGCGLQGTSLFCWGNNDGGNLGIGDMLEYYTPQPVAGTWLAVSAGLDQTCAIATDRTLWCWGRNAQGQLGDGMTASRTMPFQIGSKTWRFVSAGYQHGCAIDEAGAAYCWGTNVAGQLGVGDMALHQTPTPIASTKTDWAALDTSSLDHTCAATFSGEIWCWGAGANYVLGTGSVTGSSSPVQAL
jgi:alpha-tubulin suppressor-like RCC1 family protein